MDLVNLYNSPVNQTTKTSTPAITQMYTPPAAAPIYKIPPVIATKYQPLFIEQARMVGLTPEEFGQIAAREQGATTTPSQVKLIGQADPTDRGVMQVNKINEPLIQKQFLKEYGRNYNPNTAVDSIIAARMVLQENKRQFDQMKANQTYTNPYTNQDLIDSYNLGVQGLIKAKQGNQSKVERLSRYQSAGQ